MAPTYVTLVMGYLRGTMYSKHLTIPLQSMFEVNVDW